MTYEAAMIVVNRPGFFSHNDCWAAAKFIMSVNNPPIHIQCDHKSNQNKAENVSFMAFEGIRCQGRWPKD